MRIKCDNKIIKCEINYFILSVNINIFKNYPHISKILLVTFIFIKKLNALFVLFMIFTFNILYFYIFDSMKQTKAVYFM